jgi:hypothetical protein
VETLKRREVLWKEGASTGSGIEAAPNLPMQSRARDFQSCG